MKKNYIFFFDEILNIGDDPYSIESFDNYITNLYNLYNLYNLKDYYLHKK